MIIKKLEEVYPQCESEGFFIPKNFVDIELIKSKRKQIGEDITFLKENVKEFEKKKGYPLLFRNYFDVVRGLIETLVLFDKVKISNHQCLNAYFCEKYDKEEWEFLETIRLKRNSNVYYGGAITEEDWKGNKIKFELIIKKLTDRIDKKLR